MAIYEISTIKYQLSNLISTSVKELSGLEFETEVVIPNDLEKGDLTTNIALTSFAKIKNQKSSIQQAQDLRKIKNPMELGEYLIKEIRKDKELYSKFAKIELASPGFINFWLSNTLIEAQVGNILEGRTSKSEAEFKSLIFEFGDPNPFKEPHIGHLRMFAVGESICRLIEQNGTRIIRASYQGDVGMHVAKAIYGLLQNPKSEIRNPKFNENTLEERIGILAGAYSAGAKAFEDDISAKQEIIAINKKVYAKDPEIMEIWEKGRSLSLEYFEELYKKLGVKYEKYYFEGETASIGLEIVKDNSPRVFQVDQGAYIFKGEDEGLHTRVFINSEGNPTYEAKDLALAVLKDKDFPDIDKSIIMTANEQTDYFRVLLAALKKIDPLISEKTMHLSMGFVNLKEGKMSSRTGNVVGANWLFEETKKRLKEGFKEVTESVLEDISVASVKWSMLKFSRESNMSFSIDESIDLAGNSGPYMLYTYARICSLLEKREKGDFEAKSVKIQNSDLLALGRIICQENIIIKSAADNFSPNFLTEYLFNLAQRFNTFYEKEKIIGSENETEKLATISVVGKVIKNGLGLLGISAPEKL
jgi:arginyl-tRNA synthetase